MEEFKDLHCLVSKLESERKEKEQVKILQQINELLLTKYAIKIGDLKVVPLWVEAYYYDKDKFCDENTHKSPMQKNR